MTTILSGQDLANKIASKFPEAISETGHQSVYINADYLTQVAGYLKNSPELAFLLSDITSVDYYNHLELIYRLTSIEHNHSLVLKIRCKNREKPEVPSVTCVWKGADFMEREIFDLMGIVFTGHPNMKRIFLWEGFNGHPLRKDFAQ